MEQDLLNPLMFGTGFTDGFSFGDVDADQFTDLLLFEGACWRTRLRAWRHRWPPRQQVRVGVLVKRADPAMRCSLRSAGPAGEPATHVRRHAGTGHLRGGGTPVRRHTLEGADRLLEQRQSSQAAVHALHVQRRCDQIRRQGNLGLQRCGKRDELRQQIAI